MPGTGRNNGARVARGEFLFFIDADIILPKNFLGKVYNEMQKRYLDLATCQFKPISKILFDKVACDFVNLLIKISQFSIPHAPGFSIFVSKRLFDRVGGFDESIKIAEDHDFVKRASKYRPMRVIESTHVKMSVRRLEKEGRINLVRKYFYIELYRLLRGEAKREIVNYEFGNFSKKEEAVFEKEVKKIEKKLKIVGKNYDKFFKKYFKITERSK